MKVFKFDTRKEMGLAAAKDAAKRINALIEKKGEATAIFAAAPSQNEFLESLCEEKIDWTKVRALHMDEYIGLPNDAPAGFGNFLDRAIFKRMPFKEIYYLKGGSPEDIIANYTAVLEKYPPDIIFLGIGENGHLAFNDPGNADFDDPARVKVVKLEDVCRMQQVNDGCFAKFDDVPTHAMTLTMSQILNVPQALCIVPGKLKAAAVERSINGPVTTQCPASALRNHPDAALYLDNDSASKL